MDKLYNLLKTLELPLSYHSFKEAPTPPYIVYLFTNSDNIGADDKVYSKSNLYNIELYSLKKDLVSEQKIENLFDENNIFYEKSEMYIETEGLYQILYEIEY